MIDAGELLSDDGTAVIMLCSQLGLSNGDGPLVSPLTLREWNALARKIHDSEIKHPSALIGMPAQEVANHLEVTAIEAERIARLVARGGGLALELEQLAASGIWCVTRADESYPARIKNSLKHQAPAVFFGTGDMTILQKRVFGIVGSRDLDDRGADFARRLGSLCARSQVAVVSGGARGTDRIAMQGALDAGGYAVGILADSLIRTIRQPDVRQFIMDGRLVLLTPYRPDNGFSVGAAMGRNKIIYGAADYSVIVSSDYQKGGTWAGAIETLAAGWCPLFVRSGEGVGPGNRELINKGARPISDVDLEGVDDLAKWMKDHAASRPQQAELLLMA
jgi:predicted Rossmann fold nucleotide-binding protein DprA/Smf involved in DNA uptake